VNVWYQVRDLDAARAFYRDKLGFTETFVDGEGEWSQLERNGMEIGIVFELHGQMRLLDVFDPDGNRLQFAQELSA
jgi:catechol 2,3-dioxygenase-like lactoylglutathione lyase family enzyme